MKLSALRDFMTVAERGSLRAAARDLNVAQPSITRSIQELEKELGVALFERGAKGVALTPCGELFLRRSKAVRGELQRAQDELDQFRGHVHGQVRMCLSSVAHMAMLPNALTAFRQRYADVKLDIIDGLLPSVEQQLKDGTVDGYIGPAYESLPGELVAEKLFDNERVIVCRRGHPLAGAGSLRELAQAEWLTTAVTYRAEEELTPLFTSFGLPAPRIVLQAHSAFTYLFSLVYSDLLMLAPVQWTQTPLFRDALQCVALHEKLPSPPISIVRRVGLPMTPAADHFCDLMRRASRHMDTLLAKVD